MKQRISQVFRSTFGFLLVGLFLLTALFIHLWILFSNYAGIVQSLEMLGYDQKPLSENRFFGWLFEAFGLGDATQCELYAGALVFAMGFTLMTVCYLITQLIIHIRDRRIFLRTGDVDSARNVELTIYYNILPWLILWVPLASIISLWDIKLFALRAFGGVIGIDSPEAVASIGTPELMLREYGDRLAIRLTQFSPWGYVSVVIATSFLLEFLFIKFKDRWEILVDAFANLFTREESNPQEVTGQSLTSPASGSIPVGQNQNSEETAEEAGVPVPSGEVSMEESNDVVTLRQIGFDMDEEVEVIGGNGNRIKRSHAIEDRNRFYMDGEGKVWDKRYYNSLHAGDTEEAIEEGRRAA
jgi:hypothetical protein